MYTISSILGKHKALHLQNVAAYTGKEEKKTLGLYPISEAISGGNFASRAAWNVFSAYRAMSPVVREHFVYKTRRGEEPFPATGYQNTSPSSQQKPTRRHTDPCASMKSRFLPLPSTHTPFAGQLLSLGKGRGH